jgi:hypothetical protein
MWVRTHIPAHLFVDRPDLAAAKLVNLEHYRIVAVEGREKRDDGSFRYWVVAAHAAPNAATAGSPAEPLAATPDSHQARGLFRAVLEGLSQGKDLLDLEGVAQ